MRLTTDRWVFEDAKTKNVEHVLILTGDHLYRMDYMNFVQFQFQFLLHELLRTKSRQIYYEFSGQGDKDIMARLYLAFGSDSVFYQKSQFFLLKVQAFSSSSFVNQVFKNSN
ncbi:PREDICTED: uncharacterized protein LOC104746783 [Camelina sativa]|uniref:glucose-1-phosphate adenylyltransferase n=1 Tax=Camelina sativa TaxID=90675 RepID=A0ABM0W721_CAMSA|nr:PREDICTED: uncharacterized protein LOC104746783 [Camelina sativa]